METGVLGAFDSPEALIAAIHELRRRGYRRLDAFVPYPVKGLEEALALPRSPLTWKVMPFGVLGAATGYMIQWLCNAVDYPLNVGGRPPQSAPAFIPATFETGVLFTAVFGCLIGLWLCRLPRLYSPLFDTPEFERATFDRFLVGLDGSDPSLSLEAAVRDLHELGAMDVVVARRRGES